MSYGTVKRGDVVRYLGKDYEVIYVNHNTVSLVRRYEDSRLDEYEQALVTDVELVAEQPDLGLD